MKLEIILTLMFAFVTAGFAAPKSNDVINIEEKMEVLDRVRAEFKELKRLRQNDQQELKEMKKLRQSDQQEYADVRAELQELKKLRQNDQQELEEMKIWRQNGQQEDANIRAELEKLKTQRQNDILVPTGSRICAMGSYTTEGSFQSEAEHPQFDETETISFDPPFERVPNVIASISAFERDQNFMDSNGFITTDGFNPRWGLEVEVLKDKITTTSFAVRLQGKYTRVDLTISWIAC